MSSINKPDRDWHDPPSLTAIEGLNPSVMEPQYQEEGKFNPALVPKWYRIMIIGMVYLFTGVVIEAGLYLNLPVDSLPVALIICGVIMLGYAYYSRRKNIELQIGG
jgi:uncharacterized membrane-anchored protein